MWIWQFFTENRRLAHMTLRAYILYTILSYTFPCNGEGSRIWRNRGEMEGGWKTGMIGARGEGKRKKGERSRACQQLDTLSGNCVLLCPPWHSSSVRPSTDTVLLKGGASYSILHPVQNTHYCRSVDLQKKTFGTRLILHKVSSRLVVLLEWLIYHVSLSWPCMYM